MLLSLKIENYALIGRMDVRFHNGFSVITGETGAGKSILLGALSLILGSRADTSVLFDRGRKCIVEGVFNVENYHLRDFFELSNIDYDPFTILRREISPSGRSRAFINDSPVTLDLMKSLGELLVDIYSQHASLKLNDPRFQLSVIDSYAGTVVPADEYAEKYEDVRRLRIKLENLEIQEEEARKEQDYLQFLFDEIHAASLRSDEQEDGERRLKILEHAVEIKEKLFKATEYLETGEDSVVGKLGEVLKDVQGLAMYDPEFNALSERLESAAIELKDLASEFERINNETGHDPARLEEINERLDLIYRLQHKHRVNSVEGLLEIMNDIERKLSGITSLSSGIEKLKNEIKELESILRADAQALSEKRMAAVEPFRNDLLNLLHKMGIREAAFNVRNEKAEEPGPTGFDRITYLFSANRGQVLSSLSKVASGGELSRVMLAIKSLISEKKMLPTMIFDEIDSGISGDIAGKVGDVLLEASAKMQIIAITHLPQIAGRGNNHYKVYKISEGNRTYSMLEEIDNEGRVIEIAKMLSGEDHTETARETAREFLKMNKTDN